MVVYGPARVATGRLLSDYSLAVAHFCLPLTLVMEKLKGPTAAPGYVRSTEALSDSLLISECAVQLMSLW